MAGCIHFLRCLFQQGVGGMGHGVGHEQREEEVEAAEEAAGFFLY
jgi:hypothetical protein